MAVDLSLLKDRMIIGSSMFIVGIKKVEQLGPFVFVCLLTLWPGVYHVQYIVLSSSPGAH